MSKLSLWSNATVPKEPPRLTPIENVAAGIYAIVHLPSRRLYVGSAKNLRQRKNVHFSHLKSGIHTNSYLQRTWNKSGGSGFEFRVLEQINEPENLIFAEQKWIAFLQSNRRANGFNLREVAASCLGRRISEQTKKVMRAKGCWASRPMPKHCKEMASNRAKGNRWAKGKRNAAKLTPDDITRIFVLFCAGEKTEYIANAFNVTQPTISRILNRKVYSTVWISEQLSKSAIAELSKRLKIQNR